MADPAGPGGGGSARRMIGRFGHFWWDFLIGDTPELFVGAIVVVGTVALLCLDHSLRTAAAVVLPVLVVGLLVWSLAWAGRRPS